MLSLAALNHSLFHYVWPKYCQRKRLKIVHNKRCIHIFFFHANLAQSQNICKILILKVNKNCRYGYRRDYGKSPNTLYCFSYQLKYILVVSESLWSRNNASINHRNQGLFNYGKLIKSLRCSSKHKSDLSHDPIWI